MSAPSTAAPPAAVPEPRPLTLLEAAAWLSKSPAFLRREVKAGRLKPWRSGGRDLVFFVEDLRAWLRPYVGPDPRFDPRKGWPVGHRPPGRRAKRRSTRGSGR